MAGESDQELAEQLVERARAQGLELTGPNGLLTGLTRRVLETALATELTEHLGYEPGDPAGRGPGNSRNGRMTKKVHTEVGQVEIGVPRDRNGAYPVMLIDAIFVKIREGQVANRPIYVAMGINVDGYRDVLGMWVGPTGGEGAKVWMGMLTELRNRGVSDVCIVWMSIDFTLRQTRDTGCSGRDADLQDRRRGSTVTLVGTRAPTIGSSGGPWCSSAPSWRAPPADAFSPSACGSSPGEVGRVVPRSQRHGAVGLGVAREAVSPDHRTPSSRFASPGSCYTDSPSDPGVGPPTNLRVRTRPRAENIASVHRPF